VPNVLATDSLDTSHTVADICPTRRQRRL